jgi:Uma2 family endonuclease
LFAVTSRTVVLPQRTVKFSRGSAIQPTGILISPLVARRPCERETEVSGAKTMTPRGSRAPTIGDAKLRPDLRAEHIVSMPALRPRRWTIEEVERLIDEREGIAPRYELVEGALLVTPASSGRHQRIVAELFVLVREYVRRNRLGEARLGPGEIRLTPQTRSEPDLFVVQLVDGQMPRANDPVTRVLLAVEALSPGSARHDRITKRRFFQSHGVPEYWVVDGEAEAFEVWRPGDERAALIDDRLAGWPAEAETAFELDVRQFFADVTDEDPSR